MCSCHKCLCPSSTLQPCYYGLLEGANNLEDLTDPFIFEVYARAVLRSTAWLGTESVLGSPKEPLTNLRISEGGWSDAALQDEHQVGGFPVLFSDFVSDCLSPVIATPWMIGMVQCPFQSAD